MIFSEIDFRFSFACKLGAAKPFLRATVQTLSNIHDFGTLLKEFLGL